MINEELMSKKRAIELWDLNILNTIQLGNYQGLQQIHQYIFQDVFDFAGKTRNENMAKGYFRFASALYLEDILKKIKLMPENTFDEIIEKYVEMNIAHPFREGNGRVTRIWLDLILKKNLNQCIDWSKIDKYDYLNAMEQSPINSLEIKHLLKNALTDKIYDRQVFMKGIQKSYEYDGLKDYNIEEIDIEKDFR